MDLDAFRWLLTDEGQQLLARATEAPDDELKAQAQLRRTATGSAEERASRVAVALAQVTLRRKAVAKLGDDAARMYFTADGLEQATRATVSAHRAARLAAASAGSVIDLGCGIGGDLLAFARAGITSAGVDVDPVRVEVARANLAEDHHVVRECDQGTTTGGQMGGSNCRILAGIGELIQEGHVGSSWRNDVNRSG